MKYSKEYCERWAPGREGDFSYKEEFENLPQSMTSRLVCSGYGTCAIWNWGGQLMLGSEVGRSVIWSSLEEMDRKVVLARELKEQETELFFGKKLAQEDN